jgi:hypothetical protein
MSKGKRLNPQVIEWRRRNFFRQKLVESGKPFTEEVLDKVIKLCTPHVPEYLVGKTYGDLIDAVDADGP